MEFEDAIATPFQAITRRSKARQRAAGKPDATSLWQWPQAVRTVPVRVWRSALFGATQPDPRPRQYLSNQQILLHDGVSVHYTGWTLDQHDLRVWDVINHVGYLLQNRSGPGIRADQLLRLVGQIDRAEMDESLSRMVGICVHIRHALCNYRSGLITGITRFEDTQTRYWMEINQPLAALLWRYADQATHSSVHKSVIR